MSNDRVDIHSGWTLEQLQELLQKNHVSIDCKLYLMIGLPILGVLVF